MADFLNNSMVFYRGPSTFDGSPIVAIATGFRYPNQNRKLGPGLIQTWILREDIAPEEATNSGADSAICGDCFHRGFVHDGRNIGRSCYVAVAGAPAGVWRNFRVGKYPDYSIAPEVVPDVFQGRGVRLGAYGDPAAVPFMVWERILEKASYWTGYTQQWREYPELAPYCMASTHTLADQAAAHVLGFRTYRVRSADGSVTKNEITCPASKEGGSRTSCDRCKLCNGSSSNSRKNIVVVIHGHIGTKQAFEQRMRS